VENSSPDDSSLGKFFAIELPKSLCLSQKFKKCDFSKILPRFVVLSGTKIWNIMVGEKNQNCGQNQDGVMWIIFSIKIQLKSI
jgi:hypothetical protein